MAKLVFGMNLSLDGYVDHQEFETGPRLFRHWTEQVRDLAGSVYGRRMYEIMRYWDDDDPEWDAARRDFAAAWRRQPKWVASRTLASVGPNATLVADDVEAVIRGLKAERAGEIHVSGPKLAGSLTGLGLIDEYRLYF
ncbi:MAG: dihydrofolate reductase family protein, partial [Phenylobacterium sp.]